MDLIHSPKPGPPGCAPNIILERGSRWTTKASQAFVLEKEEREFVRMTPTPNRSEAGGEVAIQRLCKVQGARCEAARLRRARSGSLELLDFAVAYAAQLGKNQRRRKKTPTIRTGTPRHSGGGRSWKRRCEPSAAGGHVRRSQRGGKRVAPAAAAGERRLPARARRVHDEERGHRRVWRQLVAIIVGGGGHRGRAYRIIIVCTGQARF